MRIKVVELYIIVLNNIQLKQVVPFALD